MFCHSVTALPVPPFASRKRKNREKRRRTKKWKEREAEKRGTEAEVCTHIGKSCTYAMPVSKIRVLTPVILLHRPVCSVPLV